MSASTVYGTLFPYDLCSFNEVLHHTDEDFCDGK